ncbi:MAG: phytanoyl-CoA dioxygenase family protein, partial [Alphaproteobacteria bacterium]|nr:phytanoyl-CoA dioxygenase family protein [Alphaproteobacteria bacterium]
MAKRHAAAHIEHFERHGWVLIERLLTEREIEAALPGLFSLYPTPESFHSGADARAAAYRDGAGLSANQGSDARFRPLQFAGLKEFPFPDQTLNLLAVHPAIIAVAEDLLHTRDVRLYQAETFAKYTGVTQYAQPFHVDYTNHVMLPPRSDGRFRQTQMFLYLSDVSEAHGATRVVSRTLTRDVPLIDLSFNARGVPPARLAEWEAQASSATGPRGSLLVYGADVVHRGSEMSLAGGGRFFFNLAYRTAGADWVGANPWPRKGMAHWTPLVERASVRQLEVLGFPPPGHDYWNAETLKGCAERYPGLDLSPWRA